MIGTLCRRLLAVLALMALAGAGVFSLQSVTSYAAATDTQVLSALEAADPTLSGGAPRVAAPVEGTTTTAGADEEIARRSGPYGDGVWAVLIGVDEYPAGTQDLRAGVTDTLDMVAALDAAGVPAGQRRVLLDEGATIGAAREALEWLVTHAGPDATAVIFFSGHIREVDGDTDGDGEAVDEAMLLADGEQLLDGEVATTLQRLEARHTWLAIAGCYGAGFDDAMAPGRLLVGAAPEGVLAYESDRYRRTYMVEYVIRRAMLEGQAGGSVQDAFAWAVEQLRRDHPNRLPVIIDQVGEPFTLGA